MNADKIEIFKEHTSPITGISMQLIPVAYYKTRLITDAIEREFRAQGKPIDPPMYEVKVGDNVQLHEHYRDIDPETGEIKTSIETDEELRLWQNHLDAKAECDQEINFAILKFNFKNGIIISVPDDGWEASQTKDGITIPDDEDDKRFHYIMTEVLTTRFEQVAVSNEIISLSLLGISNAVDLAESIRRFFRRGMGQEVEGKKPSENS